jgi:hypothetical protein
MGLDMTDGPKANKGRCSTMTNFGRLIVLMISIASDGFGHGTISIRNSG